jgi:hypothetical protein
MKDKINKLTRQNFTKIKKRIDFIFNDFKRINLIIYPDIYDESAPEAKKTNAGANSRGCAGRLIG